MLISLRDSNVSISSHIRMIVFNILKTMIFVRSCKCFIIA